MYGFHQRIYELIFGNLKKYSKNLSIRTKRSLLGVSFVIVICAYILNCDIYNFSFRSRNMIYAVAFIILLITLQIGSQTLKKNEKSEQLDVMPVIVNDTTFVPVRAVSQALDANVAWDDKTSTIKISSDYSAASSDNEPTVTMYAPDGRTIDIAQSEVEAYENVGWYKEPVVLMYAADGRTRYTLQSEVEAYQGVGWYTEPVVLMYAADGRTRYTLQSEVEAYQGVGWYTEPVVLMYAADGRTRYTLQSEVEAYQGVGWYTEPYTPPKTNSSSSGGSSGSSSSSGVVRGSTVYVTPSGKKYHYSASCAGKNARATTLSAAQASGKGPCAKCAR